MRKVDNGGKIGGKRGEIMPFIVATNAIAANRSNADWLERRTLVPMRELLLLQDYFRTNCWKQLHKLASHYVIYLKLSWAWPSSPPTCLQIFLENSMNKKVITYFLKFKGFMVCPSWWKDLKKKEARPEIIKYIWVLILLISPAALHCIPYCFSKNNLES